MRTFQFCEFLSAPEVSRWAGPIIDVLLDYVGNVQLCSRLKEHIDSYEDWAVIKEKAGRGCAAAAGPGQRETDPCGHLSSWAVCILCFVWWSWDSNSLPKALH